MKKLFLLLLTILPTLATAQYGVQNNMLVMKKITNGVVCDSCVITMAGSIGANNGQISFLTPNHDNQFLYTDSLLTSNFSTVLNTSFFVSMAGFSLDFYPYSKLDFVKKSAEHPPLDFGELQFKTLINQVAKSDWADITGLKSDPDFYFGHTNLKELSNRSDNPATVPAEHYHAGKFDLKLNDSLTVLIRNKHTLAEFYHFTIRRVRSVPDYFEFVEFPSTKSFEEILNTEVNKRRQGQGPQSANLEMEAGNSAFLRFANDEQYYFFGRTPRNSGVEYAMGDQPDKWISLGGGTAKFTNGFTYIYLHNPAAEKVIKVFLRYKHQPESVHTVTIRVKKAPNDHDWTGAIIALVAITVIVALLFYFQRKKYGKQLNKLGRKKSEIENQLQLLSGQLNPHFLFNSLNAVQGLIRQNDSEAANQYITEVATFMRTIMDSGRKELVSLLEEMRIEESYIALEQKRKKFSYHFDNQCGQNLAGIDFPPLLLQPVIENSIRHGFAEHISQPVLTITIQCDTRDLIVVIADNGTGYDPSVNAQGHGLSLTAKRIALINEKLSPMQIVVKVQSGNEKGASTEIRLLKWLS